MTSRSSAASPLRWNAVIATPWASRRSRSAPASRGPPRRSPAARRRAWLRRVQAAAHGADRDAAQVGDRLVGAGAREVAQHHDDAQGLGQALERRPHPIAQRQALDRPSPAGRRPRAARPPARPPAGAARPGTRCRGSRAASRGGGRLAQLADPPQRDQERVVHGVLGRRAVAEHPDRDRVQQRPVALQQRAEPGHVAGLRGAGERGVVEERSRARILLCARTAFTIPRRPSSRSMLRGRRTRRSEAPVEAPRKRSISGRWPASALQQQLLLGPRRRERGEVERHLVHRQGRGVARRPVAGERLGERRPPSARRRTAARRRGTRRRCPGP